MREFKVGDYVETDWESAGIEPGEQGVIIDAENPNHIQVIFPARKDLWADRGWQVARWHLKLLYRPRVKKTDNA